MLERIIISAIGFLVAWAFYVVGNQRNDQANAPRNPARRRSCGLLIALVYLFTGSIPALS